MTQLVPLHTIPMFIFHQKHRFDKGEGPMPLTGRIRPESSLRIREMTENLRQDIIYEEKIEGHSWCVLSVLSAYSTDIHVMVINLDPDRYLPALNHPSCSLKEISGLCSFIEKLIVNIQKVSNTVQSNREGTIHIGCNWSPRSWGEGEEKFGYQSLTSKWHLHAWIWPDVSNMTGIDSPEIALTWKPLSDVPFGEQRVLGAGTYIKPLSESLKNYLPTELLSLEQMLTKIQVGTTGLEFHFNCNLQAIFHSPAFPSWFQNLINQLDDFLTKLSNCFVEWDKQFYDGILQNSGTRLLLPEELESLRKMSPVRTETDAFARATALGINEELFNELWRSVLNRVNKTNPDYLQWRKGFGYGLIFISPSQLKKETETKQQITTTLIVAIGCYIGTGGIVEACGRGVRRPENSQFSSEMALTRSKQLWELSDCFSKQIE